MTHTTARIKMTVTSVGEDGKELKPSDAAGRITNSAATLQNSWTVVQMLVPGYNSTPWYTSKTNEN